MTSVPCDAFVALARESFRAWTLEHRRIDVPSGLPADMTSRRAACFVSLHSNGQLRGCIGTLAPTQPSLAHEVIENAISACSRDPRFAPVRPDELDGIECSVDVLGEPTSVAGLDELDPKRYGVIVSRGMRRGVLLPDLEGVDTVEEQVAIAKMKAGIGAQEDCDLERFEVVRHV